MLRLNKKSFWNTFIFATYAQLQKKKSKITHSEKSIDNYQFGTDDEFEDQSDTDDEFDLDKNFIDVAADTG